jgi:hypothetical protein
MLTRIALAAIAAVLAFSDVSVAKDVQVQGYFRKDGTYVEPYMRSAPDSNPYNNFSTKGNINPYTGQAGTKNPEPSYGYTNPYTNPYSPPSSLYEAPKPPAQPDYNSRISPYDLSPPSSNRSSSYGR